MDSYERAVPLELGAGIGKLRSESPVGEPALRYWVNALWVIGAVAPPV